VEVHFVSPGDLTILERDLTEVFANATPPETEDTPANPVKLESKLGKIIRLFEEIRGHEHEMRAGYVFGQNSIEYQIELKTEVRGEPYEMDWLPEPVNGFMLFYRFDSTTGTLLEFTEHDISTSKEIYRSYSEITLLTEFVDTMPEDVQERYEAAIVQYMNLMKEKGK
jgi:hypothetical protein